MDASLLVPGDIISIKLGDIIPADARLLEGDPLKIDQVFLVLSLFLSACCIARQLFSAKERIILI
jgi:hypothetical protein